MHDPLDLAFFDYEYPESLVAQAPAEPRDSSKLMHVPASGPFQHRIFRELPQLLRAGDLLVLNETKVLKARLHGVREPGGGAIELLVLGPAPEDPNVIRVLAKPARRMKPGGVIRIGEIEATVIGPGALRFPSGMDLRAVLDAHGELPLPPYISPPPGLERDRAYQTVFARVDGSVAAPTASLHFTSELLASISSLGTGIAKLTLDIGLGTFAPVRGSSFREHEMHEETFTVPRETAAAIARTRESGGRIIAVGTTVVRALESSADNRGNIRAGSAATRIFITPGYRFRAVDALITNFHVPRSTLIALVASFCGREKILSAYAEAIEHAYRLFSFGDAMFIERS